jgi:hypothetical protein
LFRCVPVTGRFNTVFVIATVYVTPPSAVWIGTGNVIGATLSRCCICFGQFMMWTHCIPSVRYCHVDILQVVFRLLAPPRAIFRIYVPNVTIIGFATSDAFLRTLTAPSHAAYTYSAKPVCTSPMRISGTRRSSITLVDVGCRPTDEVNNVRLRSPRSGRASVLGLAVAGRPSLWGAWAAD